MGYMESDLTPVEQRRRLNDYIESFQAWPRIPSLLTTRRATWRERWEWVKSGEFARAWRGTVDDGLTQMLRESEYIDSEMRRLSALMPFDSGPRRSGSVV